MKLKRIAMGLIMTLIYLLTICINVSAYGEISKKADLTISNLKELVAFRDSVNNGNTYEGKTVKLLKDIDMSSIDNWEPIGQDAKPFLGSFNGNNKTISNINIINNNPSNTVGLFGTVVGSNYTNCPVNTEIKNLNINNVKVISNGNKVGGLIGYCVKYLVSNCTITDAEINGKQGVGGIVGQCGDTKVSNCRSSAVVTGEDGVGGLLGIVGCTIVEKSNATGNISGQKKVGGLIGQLYSSDITDCFATGNISGNIFVGGLVGYIYSNVPRCKLSNCYSTGNICGEGNGYGGFVGYATNCDLIKCFSTGNVVSSSNENGAQTIGGFVGYTSESDINNSFSKGNASGNISIGGFVGCAGYKSNMSNCYSIGEASGNEWVGGFSGRTGYSTFVNDYYNFDSNKNPFGYVQYQNDVKGTPIGKTLSELNDPGFTLGLDSLIPENIE